MIINVNRLLKGVFLGLNLDSFCFTYTAAILDCVRLLLKEGVTLISS